MTEDALLYLIAVLGSVGVLTTMISMAMIYKLLKVTQVTKRCPYGPLPPVPTDPRTTGNNHHHQEGCPLYHGVVASNPTQFYTLPRNMTRVICREPGTSSGGNVVCANTCKESERDSLNSMYAVLDL
ncbi:uncharacterized protein LOC121860780 [Homarus americanus]|uniref:Uncharacterized protein n=1 Tax=Homarus americanus TaxID=6706 RepID=A0A8J5N4V8_HOMAM|nr:uncharacterized protein LOC121860780 [Homarus americanus]KAG7173277.1 hypothetical protein Hamer_G014602 [Homarus americanus]